MAKQMTVDALLRAALAQGPADAVTLGERMKAAGWLPASDPDACVHGPAHSMNRRMLWRCRRGHAACLLVGGKNIYLHRDAVKAAAYRFDLQDATARLIAADWVADQGDEVLAGLLRKARRVTFGSGGQVTS